MDAETEGVDWLLESHLIRCSKSGIIVIFTTILSLIVATETFAQNSRNSKSEDLVRTLYSVLDATSSLSKESKVNDVTQEELAIISLINQERAKAGLAELTVDPALARIARSKSRDMAQHHYFGHNSERLGLVYDQLDQAQVKYRFAAENLAGAPNPRVANQSLLANPAHRANLLNPNFHRIGIGIAKGRAYRTLVTQVLID